MRGESQTKGPQLKETPTPPAFPSLQMGRKRGGANRLGVQSRKGKGTSTTRAASLLLGLTGGTGSGGE